LAQYDFKIHYVKGEDNTVADALSRLPNPSIQPAPILAAVHSLADIAPETHMSILAATVTIETDQEVLKAIKEGYADDPWCTRLHKTKEKTLGVEERDGLLFVSNRLVIPRNREIQEQLYQAAHDAMGHFGFDKSYAALRESYFWPGMRDDLE
jgi:hypothetical protein